MQGYNPTFKNNIGFGGGHDHKIKKIEVTNKNICCLQKYISHDWSYTQILSKKICRVEN